ncbi:MAG: GNAT family protein [Acidobacteriota bacterium]
MQLVLARCELRSWRLTDLDSLVANASNPAISANLRDRFPYPYTRSHGRDFLRGVRTQHPEVSLAIAVGGQAVGGIGLRLQDDIDRVSAEVGYWLGQPYWGRGVATEAVAAFTPYAMRVHALTRVFAVPLARNVRSCRVLEKAGYHLEGRLRCSVIKNGEVADTLQYAFVVEKGPPMGSK